MHKQQWKDWSNSMKQWINITILELSAQTETGMEENLGIFCPQLLDNGNSQGTNWN